MLSFRDALAIELRSGDRLHGSLCNRQRARRFSSCPPPRSTEVATSFPRASEYEQSPKRGTTGLGRRLLARRGGARRRSSPSCSLAAVAINPPPRHLTNGSKRRGSSSRPGRNPPSSQSVKGLKGRRGRPYLCAVSAPAPLFSAASAPGSQLYAATSSPALPLHCSIDSGFGSSLHCCCLGSDAAPVYGAASFPPPALLVSAGSLLCCRRSLATRSAHRGMTSPRLTARLGSSVRLGSAARLLVDSARLLVGAAYRLVCSARLVGSSSSSFTASFELMRPSGANALRYSPSSLAPYSIASGPYEHRNTTSRHILSYTSAPDADARLHAYPLPHRSIPPASSLSIVRL